MQVRDKDGDYENVHKIEEIRIRYEMTKCKFKSLVNSLTGGPGGPGVPVSPFGPV